VTKKDFTLFGLPATMADNSLSLPKTPFDWLQGGLFFGGKSASDKFDDEENIDACDDVLSLLNGISKNLGDVLSLQPQIVQAVEANQAEDSPKLSTPSDFIAARLFRLRFLLYDERRLTSQQQSSSASRLAPVVAGTTSEELTGTQLRDLIPQLLEGLVSLPFESRKHVAAIFNYLLVCGLEGIDAALYSPTMIQFCDYVEANFDRIMSILVKGHDLNSHGCPDVCLHFGSMYRSCCRHPPLYKRLVGTSESAAQFVYPFLDLYVHLPNFEIASDAMESLRAVFVINTERVVPTDDKAMASMADIAAQFLIRDYEEIWDKRFNAKLLSSSANYMTRRIALQILSTVLLTRSNYAAMIRYIASRVNLIMVMELMRDTSPHITLDAFHVFKVFVANPNKPPEIVKILQDNKVKLCAYLLTLHHEKEESDAQFRDEKSLIIATIDGL
jgi:calcium binding protein 39